MILFLFLLVSKEEVEAFTFLLSHGEFNNYYVFSRSGTKRNRILQFTSYSTFSLQLNEYNL